MAGGLVMGLIVFYINYTHASDLQGSVTAALKQGIYTFFFGGIILKLCENIAASSLPAFAAILLGMIVTSAIAVSLTYGLHSLKGTPMPLESTIPTAVLVIPSTLVWGYRKRKGRKGSPKDQ